MKNKLLIIGLCGALSCNVSHSSQKFVQKIGKTLIASQ